MSEQNLSQLRQQLADKKALLDKRFQEVARLTEQLEKEQAEVDALARNIEAVQQQAKLAAAAPVTLALTDQQREENVKHIELIANSALFDSQWYLATYPDIAASEKFAESPAVHYTLFGGFEGRKPCPAFDSSFYLRTNPDVANARMNPLAHYLRFGRDEGRACVPPEDSE